MDPQQRAITEDFDQYRETYDQAVNKAIAFSGLTVDKFTAAKANDLVRLIKSHFESAIVGLDFMVGPDPQVGLVMTP